MQLKPGLRAGEKSKAKSSSLGFHFGMSGNFSVKGVDSPGYRRKVGPKCLSSFVKTRLEGGRGRVHKLECSDLRVICYVRSMVLCAKTQFAQEDECPLIRRCDDAQIEHDVDHSPVSRLAVEIQMSGLRDTASLSWC